MGGHRGMSQQELMGSVGIVAKSEHGYLVEIRLHYPDLRGNHVIPDLHRTI